MKEFMAHSVFGVCLIVLAVSIGIGFNDPNLAKNSGAGLNFAFIVGIIGYVWYCVDAD
tara:strand:- start:89 stop:262 length:174 start_codon:yes stop_codon:yes gene_type:complete